MYGSIFIAVTLSPIVFNKTPREEANIPFPIPEITPPDTNMYFIAGYFYEFTRIKYVKLVCMCMCYVDKSIIRLDIRSIKKKYTQSLN